MTAAKTPDTAQYAPKTPKTTQEIVVPIVTRAIKSAFTITNLAPIPFAGDANLLLYLRLTPVSVNN